MRQGTAYSKQEVFAELSDEALMAHVREGSEEAFAVLLQRYEGPLYNYLRRMQGDGAEAEDIFQETFLRVHVHRARFRPGSRFKPWLYQIATNLCRDRMRYWKRRRALSLDAPLSREDGAGTLGEQLADGSHADTGAREAETRARVAAALAKLSSKHRAVFLMARYEDMAYEEISAALRIPVGTVKSRMNRAVKQLSAALREEA